MIRTAFGLLPVIGTLHECAWTKTGWRGIDDEGVVMNVECRGNSKPPDDYVVITAFGKSVGVLMIKWNHRLPLA